MKIRMALAVVALLPITAMAQPKDQPRAEPNPKTNHYVEVPGFFKMPPGRSMGASSAVAGDSKGNIWMALFRGDPRVAKYDPATCNYIEYPALTRTGRLRRVSVDMEDRAWYGIHDRGVLGYIDPRTGDASEVKVPLELSRPYDPQPDYEGNVWFGDDGQGGTTIRYNPRTREFAFYPTPQVADQPKLEITREGAVWYCPRSGAEPGVGVLYPDVTKMTTLGAYYIDMDAISSRAALRNRPVAAR